MVQRSKLQLATPWQRERMSCVENCTASGLGALAILCRHKSVPHAIFEHVEIVGTVEQVRLVALVWSRSRGKRRSPEQGSGVLGRDKAIEAVRLSAGDTDGVYGVL